MWVLRRAAPAMFRWLATADRPGCLSGTRPKCDQLPFAEVAKKCRDISLERGRPLVEATFEQRQELTECPVRREQLPHEKSDLVHSMVGTRIEVKEHATLRTAELVCGDARVTGDAGVRR